MSDIKQIEVIRGPASAVWGANALTGVVNIITKSPREAPGDDGRRSAAAFFSRDAGSSAGKGAGGAVRRQRDGRATRRTTAGRTASSAGYFNSDRVSAADRADSASSPIRAIRPPRSAARPIRPTAPGRSARRSRTAAPASRSSTRASIRNSPTAAASRTQAASPAPTASSTPASARSTSSRARTSGSAKVELQPRRAQGQLLHELHRRRGAEPAARRIRRPAQPLQLNFYDADLRLRGRRRAAARHAARVHLRRQRPAQQLRHHASRRTPRTATSSAPTCRTRSSSTRFRFTVGGRVDKFGNLERPGLLAAPGGDLQVRPRPRRARVVQPRVPLAVGHQQLPGHAHRRARRT